MSPSPSGRWTSAGAQPPQTGCGSSLRAAVSGTDHSFVSPSSLIFVLEGRVALGK